MCGASTLVKYLAVLVNQLQWAARVYNGGSLAGGWPRKGWLPLRGTVNVVTHRSAFTYSTYCVHGLSYALLSGLEKARIVGELNGTFSAVTILAGLWPRGGGASLRGSPFGLATGTYKARGLCIGCLRRRRRRPVVVLAVVAASASIPGHFGSRPLSFYPTVHPQRPH